MNELLKREQWRQLSDHPSYEVSSFGAVRRIGKDLPLKPWKHKSGHLYLRLNGKSRQVHLLAISAFGSIQPRGTECRHLDGNPENNHIDNLEWGTRRQNIFDYIKSNGRHMASNSTLVDVAAKIKDEHDGKRGTGKKLAIKYGVSVHTVSEIRTGKTFKYI